MERRSLNGEVPTGSRPRRGFTSRLLGLSALAVFAVSVLAACGPEVETPYSTLSPASPQGEEIHSLYSLIFWLALVVFVGVQFAIVYTALRFRRTRHDVTRPPQIHGNMRLEIIWTVIPAIVLLVILVPTITTLYAQDARGEDGDLVVDVYGKQWWWEIHYAEDQAQGQSLDVVTANEIRLPVGQEAIFRMESNNVIHSFWVPRLHGKMDVIPGHTNYLGITPTEEGVYYGECAEFCGAQHAWMRFKIIVEPADDFYSWINASRQGNLSTANQEAELPEGVTRAPEGITACMACHQITGLEQNVEALPVGIEAPQNFGPNLTNYGCRETLGAGIMVNNHDNLVQWLMDPGAVKPDNFMADQVGPGLGIDLSEEEASEMADYLLSLVPEEGCGLTSAEDAAPGPTVMGTPEADD